MHAFPACRSVDHGHRGTVWPWCDNAVTYGHIPFFLLSSYRHNDRVPYNRFLLLPGPAMLLFCGHLGSLLHSWNPYNHRWFVQWDLYLSPHSHHTMSVPSQATIDITAPAIYPLPEGYTSADEYENVLLTIALLE